MGELTIRHYSVGEDDVENYLLRGKYPEGYIPKAKKQTCEENAETTSRLRLESYTTRNVVSECGIFSIAAACECDRL